LKYGADLVGGRAVIVPDEFEYFPVCDNTDYGAQPPVFVLDDANRSDSYLLFSKNDGFRFCWNWRYLYSAALVGAAARFNPNIEFAEDGAYMLDIFHRAHRIVVIRAPVVFHRISPSSITHQGFDQRRFYWFPTYLNFIHRHLADKYDDRFWREFFSGFMLFLFFESFVQPMRKTQYRKEAAAALRTVYGTPALPLKYLPFRSRMLIFLFVKGF
jgi:hypothetical protein